VVLGYRSDGKYAATVGGVGMSIPRQVGKTYFVLAMLIILCILFPGLQVVWTSHHLRTTTKTLTTIRGMAKRKRIKPHIRAVRTSHGEGQVEFANGSLIMFGARSQGFGRGFDEIDVEVFDESQILDSKALEDMIAATNQSRHEHGALLLFMGTPPRPSDPSEAFTLRRSEALAGDSDDAVWLEIGADPDSDPDDRAQWPLMNPSFPTRTPEESLLRLRKNLGDEDSWNREGRGIWDPVSRGGVLPKTSWAEQEDDASIAADNFALGVECGPDLAWASVALAGQRPDGDWHVELVENQTEAQFEDDRDRDMHGLLRRKIGVSEWLLPFLEHIVAKNPQIRAVVVDVSGPIKALLEQRGNRWFFKGSRLEATPVKVAELGAGCTQVLSGIVTGWLHHIGQPQFTTAALSAGKRALGDTGMWVWSRKSAESDITPIQAATLALIGAQAEKRQTRQPTKQQRKVVVYG
jgi:hypothetical protein